MKLMPFQVEGVRLMERFGGRVLLADEMGLGKTIQALFWLEQHNDSLPAVVVCPSYLKPNWQWEAERCLPNKRVAILEGRKVKKCRKADLYIVGYECVLPMTYQRKRKKVKNKNTWTEWLRKQGIRTVVADEAHYIKNKGAIRSKGLRQLTRNVRHLLFLTGTPIENRPAEIWHPLNILTPGLFPSWFEFGMRYCGAKYNGFGWDFGGATRLKELRRILCSKVMIRRLKKDVLKDLPKKRRTPLIIQPDSKALSEYLHAEHNFLEWVKEKGMSPDVLKAQALVKMGVLKRLAAKAKLPLIVEWVKDALEEEQKVAIYCIHRDIANALCSALKPFHPILATGDVSKKIRREGVRLFQESKRHRVFIGSFAAAGTGITLTKASHILIAELPWSGSVLAQGEDRLHRIGQTRPVWSWLAIAKNTIDEDLLSMLDWKRAIVAGALDGHKIKKEETLWEMMLKRKRK